MRHIDPLLVDLKESVLSKFNEYFSQGGIGYLCTKVGCVCQIWKTYEDKFMNRIMVLDISFIRVPPNVSSSTRDLFSNFLKKHIVDFVAKYPNCQQVKAEHQ